MDRAYLYALPVAVIAFLLSFLLREIKLRDGTEAPAASSAAVEPATVASAAAVKTESVYSA
jgi:hypothetical protein